MFQVKVSSLGVLLIALVLLFSSACVSRRDVVYFKNLPDTLRSKIYALPIEEITESRIQISDILTITIQTLDQVSNNLVLTPASNTTANTNNLNQYIVDVNGDVNLPLIGKIHVADMNFNEARALILRRANQYYKEPAVMVKYANFTISVLGEVASPKQYVFNTDKVNILEALASAGDLTYAARRDNILVIREEDGIRKFARINISSTNLFKSPCFYLKQRDVIYVEPNHGKIVTTDALLNRNISLLTIGLTSFGLFLSILSFLRK